jgi:nucleoside-diphosphate-sugar epimerase
MSLGEYVSLSSQRDTKLAALAEEKRELRDDPRAEFDELVALYQAKGLSPATARQVAVLAAGLALPGLGRPATERDPNPAVGPDSPRGGAENLALTYADQGVRVISARFAPTVHGAGDHGFISIIAKAARRRGASVYPGEGRNRWSAVHRSDAAHLVRLGLENAPAGTILHAAAEEGVPVRRIADALATRLGVPVKSAPPEQIAEEIAFVGRFLAADLSATSTITHDLLGWQPTGPTLLEDIAAGHYDQP